MKITPSLTFAAIASLFNPAHAQTSANWTKAAPILRNAIECTGAAAPINPQLAKLGMSPSGPEDSYVLPEPLTVFGTLKASSVYVFEGDEELGSSYSIRLTGMTAADVAKAARLKKDKGGTYRRVVKGGIIDLSNMPDALQLSCTRP